MDNTYTLLSNLASTPDITNARSDCTLSDAELPLSEKRFAATMVLKLLEDTSSMFNDLEYEHGNVVITFDEALTCLYELLLPSLVSS